MEDGKGANGTDYGSIDCGDGGAGSDRKGPLLGVADYDGDDYAKDESERRRWRSTGVGWRDFLHFVGPGWFVCIAYVDPGNYQADIQAGATTRYRLLWTIWWASALSIYIQSLCVRLGESGPLIGRDPRTRLLVHYCPGSLLS